MVVVVKAWVIVCLGLGFMGPAFGEGEPTSPTEVGPPTVDAVGIPLIRFIPARIRTTRFREYEQGTEIREEEKVRVEPGGIMILPYSASRMPSTIKVEIRPKAKADSKDEVEYDSMVLDTRALAFAIPVLLPERQRVLLALPNGDFVYALTEGLMIDQSARVRGPKASIQMRHHDLELQANGPWRASEAIIEIPFNELENAVVGVKPPFAPENLTLEQQNFALRAPAVNGAVAPTLPVILLQKSDPPQLAKKANDNRGYVQNEEVVYAINRRALEGKEATPTSVYLFPADLARRVRAAETTKLMGEEAPLTTAEWDKHLSHFKQDFVIIVEGETPEARYTSAQEELKRVRNRCPVKLATPTPLKGGLSKI